MMMQKIIGEIDDLVYPSTFCPLLRVFYVARMFSKKINFINIDLNVSAYFLLYILILDMCSEQSIYKHS